MQKERTILSIAQPYASLIKYGIKEFITKRWKSEYIGEVLIHATTIPNNFNYGKHDFILKKLEPFGIKEWRDLPINTIVCDCNVINVFKTTDFSSIHPDRQYGIFAKNWFAYQLEMVDDSLNHPLTYYSKNLPKSYWRSII